LKLVGLISDTHIPTRARTIPEKALEVFRDAYLIIHAGDLVQLGALSALEELASVVVVCGNMDERDVRQRLPKMNSVKIYDWKIGVVHDSGALWGTERMKRIAKQNEFNVLVFGHTHRPFLRQEDGTLFVNPGSPTNPLPPFLTKPTVGLLKIIKEKIEPKIVQI